MPSQSWPQERQVVPSERFRHRHAGVSRRTNWGRRASLTEGLGYRRWMAREDGAVRSGRWSRRQPAGSMLGGATVRNRAGRVIGGDRAGKSFDVRCSDGRTRCQAVEGLLATIHLHARRSMDSCLVRRLNVRIDMPIHMDIPGWIWAYAGHKFIN